MTLVTLIGEKTAKNDEEFIYLGPNNNCKNCKIKTVCFNLKKGRHYKVTKVRDKHHDCAVHERGVRVVEVEELPISMAVDVKLGKGDIITLDENKCSYRACENFERCMPRALQPEKQYGVVKVLEEKISCPLEKDLHMVEITE